MSQELIRPPPQRDWRARLDEFRALVPITPLGIALAVCGALVALAIAIVGFRLLTTPPPPELSLPRATPGSAVPSTTGSPSSIVVHVAGAVVRPGVYRVDSSARVDGAVAAAGGITAEADLDAVNLAAKIADGDRIFVPRKGEVPPAVVAPADPAAGATPSGPVNLNTATTAQLESLPGIGPATAQAIVSWRQQHGGFQTVQDLMQVRGIGPAKLEALRDQVTV